MPGASGPVGKAGAPDAEPTRGVLGQGIAASRSQGHAAWPPHKNRTGAAVRRARGGTHAHSLPNGAGGVALQAGAPTARVHKGQLEGSLSASLPWGPTRDGSPVAALQPH